MLKTYIERNLPFIEIDNGIIVRDDKRGGYSSEI